MKQAYYQLDAVADSAPLQEKANNNQPRGQRKGIVAISFKIPVEFAEAHKKARETNQNFESRNSYFCEAIRRRMVEDGFI